MHNNANLLMIVVVVVVVVVVYVGWHVPDVDLLLLPCFFLSTSAYWLSSWLFECVFLLVCMVVVFCSFELKNWFMYWWVCGLGWVWVLQTKV
jgi:hypothetical protein